MIRIDEAWLAGDPLDRPAGFDPVRARVRGASTPNCVVQLS
jgi:hypothetical protein